MFGPMGITQEELNALRIRVVKVEEMNCCFVWERDLIGKELMLVQKG